MPNTQEARIRRGNKANLATEALLGVPIATLDSGEFFVGAGLGKPLVKISDVEFSTTAPAVTTKLWIDTTNWAIKAHNGTTWAPLSASAAAVTFADLTDSPLDNAALAALFNLKANITDVAAELELKADVSALNGKADKADTYTKEEVDAKIVAPVDAYTKAQTDQKIADVVGAAPEALNTLKELADQLILDESGVGAITATLTSKANSADVNTALAMKANSVDTYNKTQVDAKIAAVPAPTVYTASKGVKLVGSDMEFDTAILGPGLSLVNGVIVIDDIDGGSF